MKHDGDVSRPREPELELMPMSAPAAAPEGGLSAQIQSNPALKSGLIVVGLAALALVGYYVLSDSGGSRNNAPQNIATDTSGPSSSSSSILPVPPAETGRAIALLVMADADKQKAQEAVKAGRLKIGFVTLSDSDAEDGDWVSVTAGGFRQDLRLFKNPLLVAVPYLPGQPVRVTGLVDGDGGGITVAVHVGASILKLRPLRVGESVEVVAP